MELAFPNGIKYSSHFDPFKVIDEAQWAVTIFVGQHVQVVIEGQDKVKGAFTKVISENSLLNMGEQQETSLLAFRLCLPLHGSEKLQIFDNIDDAEIPESAIKAETHLVESLRVHSLLSRIEEEVNTLHHVEQIKLEPNELIRIKGIQRKFPVLFSEIIDLPQKVEVDLPDERAVKKISYDWYDDSRAGQSRKVQSVCEKYFEYRRYIDRPFGPASLLLDLVDLVMTTADDCAKYYHDMEVYGRSDVDRLSSKERKKARKWQEQLEWMKHHSDLAKEEERTAEAHVRRREKIAKKCRAKLNELKEKMAQEDSGMIRVIEKLEDEFDGNELLELFKKIQKLEFKSYDPFSLMATGVKELFKD